MSDDELIVRDPNEAPEAPSSRPKRLGRLARDLGLVGVTGVALLVGVGWLRAPSLPAAAPALSLPALEGPEVSLADLRGQTVVVNFWATWCGPCRMEIPTLVSFAEEHPDIPVLFVAMDGEPDALRTWAAARDMPLARVLRIDAATRAAWGVGTLPTTVVVDAAGQVAHAHSGLVFGPQLWWMTR